METIKRLTEKENKPVSSLVGRRIKREKPTSLMSSVRDLIPTSECASGLKIANGLAGQKLEAIVRQNSDLEYGLTFRKRVFGDATNRVLAKAAVNFSVKECIKNKNTLPDKLLNHNVYLEDRFTVEDDGGLAKTSNYTTMSYVNNQTRRLYKFYCFREDDLNIPQVVTQKTINHTLDNDCSTDDGQVRGAIIKLFRNIESGLRERQCIPHNC